MLNFFCSTIGVLAGIECDTPVSYEVQQGFIQHMAEFGLSYGTKEEFSFRLQEFAKKDNIINEINERQQSYSVGHNKFSTWTDAEYQKLLSFRGEGETSLDSGSRDGSTTMNLTNVTDLPA